MRRTCSIPSRMKPRRPSVDKQLVALASAHEPMTPCPCGTGQWPVRPMRMLAARMLNSDPISPLHTPARSGTGMRRVIVVTAHHRVAGGHVQTGGAEKYIRQVVQALLQSGVHVHVGYSGDSIYDDL